MVFLDMTAQDSRLLEVFLRNKELNRLGNIYCLTALKNGGIWIGNYD